VEQYREDMHYERSRVDIGEEQPAVTIEPIEDRAASFARAVSVTAFAFEKIKAALPEEATAERELCDTLSSSVFELLMAVLNGATALSSIAHALHADTEEDA
jgi:hypothetical protein